MSTNYFVSLNCCDCCNRSDKIHIGKNSYGWSFLFRGYKNHHGYIETDSNKDIIVDETFKLTSWKEWKEYLKNKPIVDEYGENISYEKFIELVESFGSPNHVRNDGHKNFNHIEKILNDPRYVSVHNEYRNPDKHWVDEQGYSFSKNYFS